MGRISFLIAVISLLAPPVSGQELLGWGSVTFENTQWMDLYEEGDFSMESESLEIGLFSAYEEIGEGDLGAVYVSDSSVDPDWDAFFALLTDGEPSQFDLMFSFPSYGGAGWGYVENGFFTFGDGVGPVDFQGTEIEELTATVTDLLWDWDEYYQQLEFSVTLLVEVCGDADPTPTTRVTWGSVRSLYR